jgi:hypothetical protein
MVHLPPLLLLLADTLKFEKIRRKALVDLSTKIIKSKKKLKYRYIKKYNFNIKMPKIYLNILQEITN